MRTKNDVVNNLGHWACTDRGDGRVQCVNRRDVSCTGGETKVDGKLECSSPKTVVKSDTGIKILSSLGKQLVGSILAAQTQAMSTTSAHSDAVGLMKLAVPGNTDCASDSPTPSQKCVDQLKNGLLALDTVDLITPWTIGTINGHPKMRA